MGTPTGHLTTEEGQEASQMRDETWSSSLWASSSSPPSSSSSQRKRRSRLDCVSTRWSKEDALLTQNKKTPCFLREPHGRRWCYLNASWFSCFPSVTGTEPDNLDEVRHEGTVCWQRSPWLTESDEMIRHFLLTSHLSFASVPHVPSSLSLPPPILRSVSFLGDVWSPGCRCHLVVSVGAGGIMAPLTPICRTWILLILSSSSYSSHRWLPTGK